MIVTHDVSFKIGDFELRRVNLDVGDNEYFALLGPPGSGKSILLECLCGLKKIDSGRIRISGRDVTNLEPRKRSIGYVPQDYALFSHLTVEANIAFGLRARRRDVTLVAQKVHQTAELLGIKRLLARSTHGLSGGERQRVALARALVLEPKVLLLDEPVCALDEVTRQQVCRQLLEIHRQLGLTTIHVSHNLEEAFSVADKAGVLHDGVLRHVGTLEQLMRKPRDEFVARFMRCENILVGEARRFVGDDMDVEFERITLRVPGRHDGPTRLVIRPEDVVIGPLQYGTDRPNQFEARMVSRRSYGGYVRVVLEGPLELVAHVPRGQFAELEADQTEQFTVELPPTALHVLA